MIRRLLTIMVAVAACVGLGSAVSAGEGLQPFDSNTGYDHVNQPPPGAASSADWCFSFSDFSLVGDTIQVTASGPNGTVTGEGVVDLDGTAKVRAGITEGGQYRITSITAARAGISISSSAVAAIDVIFDPSFVDCFEGLSIAPLPPPTTIPEPTTTPAPETTTAPTTEPAIVIPPPPVTSVFQGGDPAPTGGGNSVPWWILTGGGIAILLGGGLIFFGPKSTGGGTKTRGGEEDEEDEEDEDDGEDVRDTPVPPSQSSQPRIPNALAAKLVTGGDLKGLLDNPGEWIKEPPPSDGARLVGTHFIGLATLVYESTANRDHSEFQIRQLDPEGVIEKEFYDADDDMGADLWMAVEADRKSVADSVGTEVFARGNVETRRKGAKKGPSKNRVHDRKEKWPDRKVRIAGKSGTVDTESVAIQREETYLTIQFVPQGPASAHPAGNVFSADGKSTLNMSLDMTCDRCLSSPTHNCNPKMAAEASGGFHVEGQPESGATMFRYTNATTDAEVKKQAAGGGGVDLALAGTKVGVPWKGTSIMLTEVTFALKNSVDHNSRAAMNPVKNGHRLLHHSGRRLTILARSSTTGRSMVSLTPDNVLVTGLDVVTAAGRAQVTHDVTMEAETDEGFNAAWGVHQKVLVRFHHGEGGQPVTVTVGDKSVTLVRPAAKAGELTWWKRGG